MMGWQWTETATRKPSTGVTAPATGARGERDETIYGIAAFADTS